MADLGERARLVDLQEDGNAVTVIVDHPDVEVAQVHVLEGKDCTQENLNGIIRANPEAVVMGVFGIRAVIEKPAEAAEETKKEVK